MPTYTFRCESCEHQFDRFAKISEMDKPTEEPCPECGKMEVKRWMMGGNYAFMSPEALGRKKPPSDFREFVRNIRKAHPGSKINDRY